MKLKSFKLFPVPHLIRGKKRIIIPLQKYNERSPTQTQVYFYEKTKVEKFAPLCQPDGLVMKIYNFNDFARFLLNNVEHRYRNRGDKLYKRVFYPFEHKTIDYYLPGQIWHWKRVEEVEASYRKVFSIRLISNQD